ncbi:MAG: hypothetical protein ACJ8G7_21695 [Rhizobacter sp.]
MKPSHFIAGALALAAAGAHAQSSNTNITLYGIVDAYVQAAHGAATLTRLQ